MRFDLLIFREVHIFDIHDAILFVSQEYPKQVGIDYFVDGGRPDDHFCDMRVPLIGDCESGGHASVALRLRVRQVVSARFVDIVGFAAQGRHALLARLLVLAVVLERIQVVPERVVRNVVLAFFAFLVVRVAAQF